MASNLKQKNKETNGLNWLEVVSLEINLCKGASLHTFDSESKDLWTPDFVFEHLDCLNSPLLATIIFLMLLSLLTLVLISWYVLAEDVLMGRLNSLLTDDCTPCLSPINPILKDNPQVQLPPVCCV